MELALELVSTSLRTPSRSRALLAMLADTYMAQGVQVHCTDLRDLPQVFCDGRALEAYPAALQALHHRLASADGVILAMPVYCYAVAGPTKNLVDIVGAALAHKPVALVSAAGSVRSHLAIRDLMGALVFEFATYVCPATIQVTGDSEGSETLQPRVAEFAEHFTHFVQALSAAQARVSAHLAHA